MVNNNGEEIRSLVLEIDHNLDQFSDSNNDNNNNNEGDDNNNRSSIGYRLKKMKSIF